MVILGPAQVNNHSVSYFPPAKPPGGVSENPVSQIRRVICPPIPFALRLSVPPPFPLRDLISYCG